MQAGVETMIELGILTALMSEECCFPFFQGEQTAVFSFPILSS